MTIHKELIESARRFNELMGKFNKAEDFFEKYPNYQKTNPKECKDLQKRLLSIVKELAELDWIHKHKQEFVSDDHGIITLNIPTQAKLF